MARPALLLAAATLTLLAQPAPLRALIILEPEDVAGIYDHVTATFGPRLPAQGIEANVTVANPRSCCTPISTDGVPNHIVMCERGDCTFVEKVKIAQNAGALAVVVANDQGEHLFKMYPSDNADDVVVPSVFVTTNTGNSLPGSLIMLNATGEYNFNEDALMHPYFFMAVILLGLSVTLACTLTATLAGYLVIHLRKRRERGECRRLVSELKTRKFRAAAASPGHAHDDDAPSCIICLEDFEDGDTLRMLPCGHEYHKDCIDPWLLQKSTQCPMCKQNITSGAVRDLHGTQTTEPDTSALAPEPAPARHAADAGAAATPVTALMTGGVYSEEVVEDDVDVEVEDVDVEVEEEHMLRGSIQSNSSAASSSPGVVASLGAHQC